MQRPPLILQTMFGPCFMHPAIAAFHGIISQAICQTDTSLTLLHLLTTMTLYMLPSHVFRSMNGGLTWEDIGGGLPDVPTNAIAVDPVDHRILYVGNDLGVWASTDYGSTWNVFCEGLPEAVMVIDLSISDSNRLLRAATHGNGVYERTLLPPTLKNVTPPRR
jgi:hypothetical protein